MRSNRVIHIGILALLWSTCQVYCNNYCNGRLILNRVENVQLENAPTWVPAKIDTGADMSSLWAANVQYFKRPDGPWVFFMVPQSNAKPILFYKPIIRTTTIKNSCPNDVIQYRPIVEMNIKIAGQQYKTLVNLTNRGGLQYAMLIGSNTIKEMNAVVDVNNEPTRAHSPQPPLPQVPVKRGLTGEGGTIQSKSVSPKSG